MANREHVKYLINAANIADGRKKWLDYKLNHKGMDLNGIDLSNEDMHDFDFSDLDLNKANFYNADLTGVDFSDARLDGADFRRAILIGATLDRATLKSARFQGAVMSDSCLEGTDLTDASLQGADLTGADLGEARLAGTDMRQAILKYTRMSGAVLDKANVAEADLTGSVMDDGAPQRLRNFDLAVVDDRKYRVMRSKVQANVVPVAWEDTARFTVPPAGNAPPPPEVTPQPLDSTVPPGPARNPDSTVEFVMHTPPPPHAPPQPPPEERRKATHNDTKHARRATDEDTASKRRSGEDSKTSREGMRRFFFREETPKPRKPTPDNPLALEYVAKDGDLATDEGCAKILSVRITDSPADITKAFRALAKVLHPDKVNHHPPEIQAFARDQFELCHRAHDRLKRRTAAGSSAIVWVEGIPRRRSPYEHTIDELERLVRVNPGNDGLIYNLAWKHYEVGNLDQAIFYFERSCSVNPANEDAHVNLKAAKLQKALRMGGGH